MRKIKRTKKTLKIKNCLQTKKGRIPFMLTRSSARRTLTIVVDGRADVHVASPYRMAEEEIHAFIAEKTDWIIRKMDEARKNRDYLDQKEFDHGHWFLFLGEKYPIEVVKKDVKRSRVDFHADQGWNIAIARHLSDYQRQVEVKAKMIQWYRAQAAEILGGRVFHYARLMDVEPKKIALRTQKRLWGCCDYNTRTIHLNWQIILSPISVIDYVVVHELCHLLVPNHSKRFWGKVRKVMPDYQQHRQWLNRNHLDMMLP